MSRARELRPKLQEQMMADDDEQLGLATEVTIAWLSNPHTRAQAGDVSAMLGSILTAIRDLDGSSTASDSEPTPIAKYEPAVTARRSLASPDRIISMIDGTPHSSLKRHLRAHGLTPDEYRQRYGLRADYPMVAPAYSAARSAAAKQHQFGRKPTTATSAELPVDEASAEPTDAAAQAPAVAATPKSDVPAKRRRLGISGAKKAAQTHLGSSQGGTAPDTGSA